MMLKIAEWGLQKNHNCSFFFLAVEGIICDLSSLNKNQIHAPCIAKTEL